MAVDITTIGIEYDTSGLLKGTLAQDKVTESAMRMAGAFQDAQGRWRAASGRFLSDAEKVSLGVKNLEADFSSFNKILGFAAAAFAAVGGVMLAKQFTETADAVSLMDARLKMATGSIQDFKQAQKDIYSISQANNVGIQETTSLYTKLSDPVRRLGGTSKEVAAIVDSFATSLRVGGASAQEASAATLQFAQAMGSGRLQGDEFRSIAEASPRFMKALADGMGVPIEKLKELGSEGKLTADIVGNSLVKSLDQLKKEAAGLPDTVSGAITRFKNDVILAVGEISNSQGFTVGFSGLIEQARGLIPVIKDEVMGAFVAVNGWIERNKEEIGKVWEVAKGIVGDVWEVAKGAFSVAGFIVEWATQSGLVKTTFETIRFLIAGFQDGVTAIGAGFAYVGSQIFQMVLMPLQKVLETTAKVAGVFDDQMAANLRAVAKEIDDFAKGGENYAKSVADAFGKGDSAVGRLNAELGKSKEATKEVGKAAAAAGGDFKALQSTVTDTGKKTKQLSIEQQAAQSIREQAHKREIDMLKSIDKEMASYAKDQIDRSKEVTKEIIAGINEQSKAFLSYNKSLDDHAQRMSDMNTLAQLEIDTLGMSSVQRNTLIEQKKIELALEKQLKDIRASSMTDEAKNILEEKAKTQANIDKSTAELRAQQGEWTKFYGEIYNGLSDSLYRGFEAGKGFGRSFLDSLKNLFKTNVLKIAVQAVMGGATSTLSSMAQAFGGESGGSSGGISSYISMGKSIYEGFSSGFSGFGNSVATYVQAGLDKAGLSMTSGGNSAFASGAGTAASYAGGAAIGVYGGRAISGGYSVTGGNAAVNIGTAIGAIWGPIGMAIGGAIGGLVNRAFGRKADKLQQSELSGSFGGDGFSGSVRDVYKAEGGWFSGDKWSEKVNPVGDTKSLTDAFMSIKLAASGYASILGLSAESLNNFSKEFKVNLSITGDAAKDAAANEKIMTDLINGLSNDISNFLAPSLSKFAKDGEQAAATIARLSNSLLTVNGIMSSVGITEFAKSLEGASAAERLAELTGGIEKLATGAQFFFENFLTDAEKIKPSMELVSSTMAGLGQSSVDTIEEFKNLVQGLDLSTQSGAEMYAKLIEIAPQFKAVADYAQSATGALQESAEALRQMKAIQDERKSLQDELDDLIMTEAQLIEKKKATYYEQNLDIFDQIQAEKARAAQLEADAKFKEELARAQAEQQALFLRQQEESARRDEAAANQAQQAANQIAQAWKGLTDSVFDEVKRIRGLMSSNSAMGFASAQTAFTIASAKASAGDEAAYKALPDLSKALLSIAEQQAPTLDALRLIQAQTAASLLATSAKLGYQLPSFAVGTDYVPQDMIAQVHKGEQITPAPFNPTRNKSELQNNTSMRDLIQRVEMLSFELKAIAGHTSSTARNLDRVIIDDKLQIGTPQGEPIETTVG